MQHSKKIFFCKKKNNTFLRKNTCKTFYFLSYCWFLPCSGTHREPFSCAYFRHSICLLYAAVLVVSGCHGQTWSCAYFTHSKYPSACCNHRPCPISLTAILVRVFQTLQMCRPRSIRMPRTSVRVLKTF